MKKARVLKSWRHLPDELWSEILSRLPVKSLLRFRSVSRSWKIWIDDPRFSRLHLNRFNNRPHDPQIVLVQGRHSEYVVKNSETLETISSLGFLQSDLKSARVLRSTPARNALAGRMWEIVSSIDGLILLGFDDDLMLWNPTIRKTLPLPTLQYTGLLNSGLGFDPLTRDYKVVKFGMLVSGVPFAAVYTLATKKWRVIDYHLPVINTNPSIYYSGVLYCLARDCETFADKLVIFDLSSEIFYSFELPVSTEDLGSKCYLTTVHDDCSLALIHFDEFNISMWVLDRLDVDTTTLYWIHQYTSSTVHSYEIGGYDFLCIKKNGDMLMQWHNKVICYNLETQQQKLLMKKNRKSFQVHGTVTYMESLIMHS